MEAGETWQRGLIAPSVERLLAVTQRERVLELACGNGEFARRLTELGARCSPRTSATPCWNGLGAEATRSISAGRRDGRGSHARARRARLVRRGGLEHGHHGHDRHCADGASRVRARPPRRPPRRFDAPPGVQQRRYRARDGRGPRQPWGHADLTRSSARPISGRRPTRASHSRISRSCSGTSTGRSRTSWACSSRQVGWSTDSRSPYWDARRPPFAELPGVLVVRFAEASERFRGISPLRSMSCAGRRPS